MSPDPNSPPQTNSATGTAVVPAREGTATGNNGNPPKPRLPKPVFGPIATAMIILFIVAAIYFLGISSKPDGWLSLPSAWLWIMALLVVLCVVLGSVISNRPLGILVNNRNLMSLSRLQMVAWSVVILSAVLAIVFRRIATPGLDPFALAIDKHLWALLGISTASLVGTPLILQNKSGKEPDEQAIAKTATTLQAGGDTDTKASIEENRQGTLFANPDVKDARITDMFQGDEVGNTAYVDIAKVQMFLFTVMTIVAYCYAIYAALAQPSPKLEMPVLSEGMIAMLGISHAGYLGSKAADHTPTTK